MITISTFEFIRRQLIDVNFNIIIHICGWIVASAALFIVYFTLFSYNMVCYLKEIADGIARISAGDFTTNIRVKDEDELSTIAYSINKMRSRINTSMEKEREVEKTKNELITNVAHDLKTPLTSIIGYLELLKYQKNLSLELQEKYITVAADKSKRLKLLMEDLFDYTRYDRNKVKLHLASIELGRFMEQLVDEFYPEISKYNLRCICDFPKDEIWILGDGQLLARGFGNILSNAIKYGHNGKVIKVVIEKVNENVVVSITNFGTLIPALQIHKIFNQFYRLENSRSEHTGGTGLGLAIAKNIVRMHNGEIRAKSDSDGTVFMVTLHIDKKRNVLNEQQYMEQKRCV